MPPGPRPEKTYKPLPTRLKRCTWRELDKRLADERAAFHVPINDLGFDDRNIRVRILMKSAYRMGRRDAADLARLRKLADTHAFLFKPKGRRAR